ncbi:MAG: S8 family serine peptidase [Deltaproteobacteria bacterium]|nr:S8 family serine peptidase [Deltaproteobacteria bacterium]
MLLPSLPRTPVAKFLLAALALFLGLALAGPPAQAQDKIGARQELAGALAQNGQARVLVQFSAPGLESLTNTSRSARQDFQARGAKALNEAALLADQALTKAVAGGADAVLSRLPRGGYSVIRRLGTIPFLALSVTQDGLDALEFNPAVVRVRPDRTHPLLPPPEDRGTEGSPGDGAKPETGSPAAGWSRVGNHATATAPPIFTNLNQSTAVVGAPNAWSRHYTGAGWYVAILDNGIRKTHEMFAGKTIYEACFASGENLGGDCPNGGTSMVGSGAAVHYASFYPSWDHGTHVSGIAAGHSDTVKGMAPDADIIAIQTYSKFYTALDGNYLAFRDSDMLAALDQVYQLSSTYQIASVNISGGGGSYADQTTCDADNASYKALIDNLRSVGIPTFISSGNDGVCDYVAAPACVSTAVAVGASTQDDKEWLYNNWQSTLLDVFAPGYQIYSSTGDTDISYEYWDGTSMAAPHWAGAFALMRQFSPTGNLDTLLNTMLSRGVQIATPCASGGSKPRLQVDKSMITEAPVTSADRMAMYRCYNPTLYYHLFTTNYAEFLDAVLNGYNDESQPIPFYALKTKQTGSYGLNLLYNPGKGTRYYTANQTEANFLVSLGWNLQQVEGYIYLTPTAGASQIHKLYNSVTGTHLYTASPAEWAYILAYLPTWEDNGLLGYAFRTAGSLRVGVAAAAAGDATGAADAAAKTSSGGVFPSGTGGAAGAAAGGAGWGAGGLGGVAAKSARGRAVRDFNGDGASDLVWLDAAGKVILWYLNGESVVRTAKLAPTAPAGWQLSQVGDFNGDSHPDLLWYHPADGQAALWLLSGETVTSQVALGQVADPAWSPVLAADFNGDGTDDLLWRHPATGGVAVWHLAEGKLVKAVTLPENLSPAWQGR